MSKKPAPTRIYEYKPRKRLPADAVSWSADQIGTYIAEYRTRVDVVAHGRLYDILNAACVDKAVIADPALAAFCGLMRELLTRSHPGDSLEIILEPVPWLFARGHASDGAPKRKEAAAKLEDENLTHVRREFKSLGPALREARGVTVAIVKMLAQKGITLSDTTVRKHLKTVRDELKTK